MDYDSCDWRCGAARLAWHRFVCGCACHWVSPIHLRALNRWQAGWSIHSGLDHTHCRHEDGRIYDPNASALRFDPLPMMDDSESFELEEYTSRWF